MRRPKPEVAEDIGNWMGALETLSNLNVVTNTIFLYYTHTSYKLLLTQKYSDGVNDRTETVLGFDNPGLEMVEFLLILMIAEHIQVAIKALISFFLGETPQMVTHGLMERKMLLDKFNKTKNKKNKKDKS